MIVVDSNIVAYLYLPCDFTRHAEELLISDPRAIALAIPRDLRLTQ
jgi:hypothetical protein